jgi:hypothetical protein
MQGLVQDPKGNSKIGVVNCAIAHETFRVLGAAPKYCPGWPTISVGDMAYGGVGWMKRAFEDVDLPWVLGGYVPDDLREYAPSFEIQDVDAARKRFDVFLKPVPERQKAFPGFVATRENRAETLINLVNYKGNVIVIDRVDYASEWRYFVHWGEIIGASHYKGNFRTTPAWDIADKIAKQHKSTLPSWSFDLGVLAGENITSLLEVHQVFTLGLYGLSVEKCCLLFRDTWEQLWNMRAAKIEEKKKK